MTKVKSGVSDHGKATPTSPALATIMVHVDWNAGSDDRVRLAANLADRFGAVLIGVAGWVPGRERTGLSRTELEQPEKRLKWIRAELDRLGERFREVAGITALPAEWRGSFNFPREVIARDGSEHPRQKGPRSATGPFAASTARRGTTNNSDARNDPFGRTCRLCYLQVSAGDEKGREIIATRIIDLARSGLIDPAALRDRVITEARLSE